MARGRGWGGQGTRLGWPGDKAGVARGQGWGRQGTRLRWPGDEARDEARGEAGVARGEAGVARGRGWGSLGTRDGMGSINTLGWTHLMAISHELVHQMRSHEPRTSSYLQCCKMFTHIQSLQFMKLYLWLPHCISSRAYQAAKGNKKACT